MSILAQECLIDRCHLPNCFCSRMGIDIPSGFASVEIPQMVLLTFDESITDRAIDLYKSLFSGDRKNPNGCAISGTFFVEHKYNNYDQTQWLYSNGHEIGVQLFR